MIFARNALASGPGNACNSIHLSPTCWKVGKKGYFSDFTPSFSASLLFSSISSSF
jgi:hypothetical protein